MAIGKITVDFKVLTPLEPTLLIIIDNSEWLSAADKQSFISIYPPGSQRAITNIFSKHKLNIFNSVNLQLSGFEKCEEQELAPLPDGIWKICVKSSYKDLDATKYHLKTDSFMVLWYKEWIKVGFEYSNLQDNKYDALNDVRKHITTAEGFTLQGDFVKAGREFEEAQKKFDKLTECKNCL